MKPEKKWQKTDPTLRSHPSFLDLVAELDSTPILIDGLLSGLWRMAFTDAPDGDVSRFKHRALARAVGWPGDGTVMLHALTETGFLYVDGDRVLIHDWSDWGGALFRERGLTASRVSRHRQGESNSQRQHQNNACAYCGGGLRGQKAHADHMIPSARGGSDTPDNIVFACADCNMRKGTQLPWDFLGVSEAAFSAMLEHARSSAVFSFAVGSDVTLPAVTSRYPRAETKTKTKKEQDLELLSDSGESNDASPDDFDFFWTPYPRKESKQAARRSWKRVPKKDRAAAAAAAESMHDCVDRGWQEKTFCPHPSTFLNQRRWEDWADGPPPNYLPEQRKAGNLTDVLDAGAQAFDLIGETHGESQLGTGDDADDGTKGTPAGGTDAWRGVPACELAAGQ